MFIVDGIRYVRPGGIRIMAIDIKEDHSDYCFCETHKPHEAFSEGFSGVTVDKPDWAGE